jgi:hypothetical protein
MCGTTPHYFRSSWRRGRAASGSATRHPSSRPSAVANQPSWAVAVVKVQAVARSPSELLTVVEHLPRTLEASIDGERWPSSIAGFARPRPHALAPPLPRAIRPGLLGGRDHHRLRAARCASPKSPASANTPRVELRNGRSRNQSRPKGDSLDARHGSID